MTCSTGDYRQLNTTRSAPAVRSRLQRSRCPVMDGGGLHYEVLYRGGDLRRCLYTADEMAGLVE